MPNPPRLIAFFAVLFLLVSAGLAADRAAVYTVILDGPSVGQQLAATKQAGTARVTTRGAAKLRRGNLADIGGT